MRFLKIGNAYVNMDCVETIRHCGGNVVEAVMLDGNRIYGSKEDLDRMEIVEKGDGNEAITMVE